MKQSSLRRGIQAGLFGLMAWPGWAAAADFDGAQLTAIWGVPFAGILLSIALMPLLTPHFWHHHYGKVAAAWSLAFLLPFAAVFGAGVAGVNLVHALLAEYIGNFRNQRRPRHGMRVDCDFVCPRPGYPAHVVHRLDAATYS